MGRYLSSRQHVVVGSGGANFDAVTIVRNTRPDVLLQDAGLVGDDTLRELRRDAGTEQPTRIVLVTDGHEEARSALVAGLVDVTVPRTSGLEEMERVITAAAAQRPADRSRRQADGTGGPAAESLTPREQEVVELLVRGCSTEQIAAQLGIRKSTVHTHVQGVLRKLGARSRLEAVSRYLASHPVGDHVPRDVLSRAVPTEHG